MFYLHPKLVLSIAAGILGGFVFAHVAVPGASAHRAESTMVHRYAVADRYVSDATAYGGDVFWTAGMKNLPSGGSQYLYESTVTHWRPRIIAMKGPSRVPDFADTQVSANWIVWVEGNYSWSIWAMNRHTGKITLVDSSKSEGQTPYDWTLPNLSLEGGEVVWAPTDCLRACVGAGYEHWISYLKMRNLPGGPIRTVYRTYAPCHQYWPSAAQGIVVWMQEGKCAPTVGEPKSKYTVSGTDLLMLDRRDGKITQLTHNHVSAVPTTNGKYVGYKVADGRMSNGAIFVLDLSSHKTFLASKRAGKDASCRVRAGPSWPWTQCDIRPDMLAHNLTWLANADNDVSTYSLSSHRRYEIDAGGRYKSVDYPLGSEQGDRSSWLDGVDLQHPKPGEWPIKWYVVVATIQN